VFSTRRVKGTIEKNSQLFMHRSGTIEHRIEKMEEEQSKLMPPL
jgi:hypothetical protein